MLAGTAALVMGVIAKVTGTERAEATHGSAPAGAAPGMDTIALHVGQTNPATASTLLNLNSGGAAVALRVNNNVAGIGVDGRSTSSFGMLGVSSSNAGVFGSSTSDLGVYGASSGGAGVGVGVYGDCSAGVGVQGRSTAAGVGVRGQSVTGFGILGFSDSNAGVFGSSNSNLGVYGQSTGAAGLGVGVFGDCAAGNGVQGRSSGAGTGVYGQSSTGVGVSGYSPSGLAGRFDGATLVNGNFTATGTVAVSGDLVVQGQKSALVPHSDGSMRLVYCIESPESWFEDFGEAMLEQGTADVALDRDFAETVHTNHYQVFLTEYADTGGLFVVNRTPTGFRVQARRGLDRAAFGYRIVAKRKDVEGKRLDRVTAPVGPNSSRNQVPGAAAKPANPRFEALPAVRTEVPKAPGR